MTLTIGSNIFSLQALSSLSRTNERLKVSLERLGSGLRINRASDDPAGLMLADALRADSRIAAVGVRNANDGISITNLADEGLQAIGAVLNRMAELAGMAANSAFTNVDRTLLQQEFVALGSEITRISKTTEFNSIRLLSDTQAVAVQVGFNSLSSSLILIQGTEATLSALNLAEGGSDALSYSIVADSENASQAAATTALQAVMDAIEDVALSRGMIGAMESRLGSAVNTLEVARENFAAAESAIRDVDIAREVANAVRLEIVQQAATAVLAQANLQPSRVYELIENSTLPLQKK